MFRHLAENPDLPRFMVQEVVLGEVPSPRILDAIKLVIGTLSGILRDGQKEGTVVPGDPVLLALSTLSQPIYLTIMPRVLKREMPRDRDLPVPRKSPENHAVAFLRRGFLLEEQRNES
jgi:hypothetical protein